MTVTGKVWQDFCSIVMTMGEDAFMDRMNTLTTHRIFAAPINGRWRNPLTGSTLVFRPHTYLPEMIEVHIRHRKRPRKRLIFPSLMADLLWSMIHQDGDNVAFHGMIFDRSRLHGLFSDYLTNLPRHTGR